MKPDLFEQDLLDIPSRLNELADRLDADNPWAALASRDLLLSGMGSSQYAARTAAGWLRHAGAQVTDEIASTIWSLAELRRFGGSPGVSSSSDGSV